MDDICGWTISSLLTVIFIQELNHFLNFFFARSSALDGVAPKSTTVAVFGSIGCCIYFISKHNY